MHSTEKYDKTTLRLIPIYTFRVAPSLLSFQAISHTFKPRYHIRCCTVGTFTLLAVTYQNQKPQALLLRPESEESSCIRSVWGDYKCVCKGRDRDETSLHLQHDSVIDPFICRGENRLSFSVGCGSEIQGPQHHGNSDKQAFVRKMLTGAASMKRVSIGVVRLVYHKDAPPAESKSEMITLMGLIRRVDSMDSVCIVEKTVRTEGIRVGVGLGIPRERPRVIRIF